MLVTVKIRTSWAPKHHNCIEIAQLPEDYGIQALTIQGATYACLFNGNAENNSILVTKQNVAIQTSTNGDITDSHKSRVVLD